MKKIIFALTFILVLETVAYPQKLQPRESLGGITSVSVTVEKIDKDAERDGLSRDQVQTDVELRLRKANIQIREKTDSKFPTYPQLYVIVNAVKSNVGIYAFSVDVQVNDVANLTRKPPRLAIVTIWDAGTTGSVGASNVRKIRESISDVVDQFINDYLAANPK
jgi:hypothetical protein